MELQAQAALTFLTALYMELGYQLQAVDNETTIPYHLPTITANMATNDSLRVEVRMRAKAHFDQELVAVVELVRTSTLTRMVHVSLVFTHDYQRNYRAQGMVSTGQPLEQAAREVAKIFSAFLLREQVPADSELTTRFGG